MAITSSSFPWGSDASDKVTIEWDPAVKSQPIKVYTTANNTGSSRVMNHSESSGGECCDRDCSAGYLILLLAPLMVPLRLRVPL